MKKLLILTVLGVGLAIGAYAQGVVPGAAAPDFTLNDAVSGRAVSLADFKGQKAVVLVFTSNYCPYSRLYEGRINQLVGQYKDKGVAFVLINPNNAQQNQEESEQAMKQKAESWGNGLPYLTDKQQVTAKKYGASKTPEVYVLTPRNGSFTVYYAGAIDDNPQVAADVSQPYLQQAIESALTGKTAVVKTKRPVGCMIKMP
jgi:peroxiredoxin